MKGGGTPEDLPSSTASLYERVQMMGSHLAKAGSSSRRSRAMVFGFPSERSSWGTQLSPTDGPSRFAPARHVFQRRQGRSCDERNGSPEPRDFSRCEESALRPTSQPPLPIRDESHAKPHAPPWIGDGAHPPAPGGGINISSRDPRSLCIDGRNPFLVPISVIWFSRGVMLHCSHPVPK